MYIYIYISILIHCCYYLSADSSVNECFIIYTRSESSYPLFKDGIWMSPNLSVLLSLCVYRRTQPLYNFKPISPSPLPPLPLSCCGPIVVGLCGRQAGPQGCPYPGAVRRGSTATGRLSASAAQLRMPHSLPLVFSWSLLSVAVLSLSQPRTSALLLSLSPFHSSFPPTYLYPSSSSSSPLPPQHTPRRGAVQRPTNDLRRVPEALPTPRGNHRSSALLSTPVTGTAVFTQAGSELDRDFLALLTPMGSDDGSGFLSYEAALTAEERDGGVYPNPLPTPLLQRSAEAQSARRPAAPKRQKPTAASGAKNTGRAPPRMTAVTSAYPVARAIPVSHRSYADGLHDLQAEEPQPPAVVRRGGGIILSEDFLGPRMALVPPPRQAAHDVPCESDSERSSKVKRAIKEVERKVLLAFTMRDSSKLYGSASYRSRDGAARGEAYEERHCHLSVEHSVEESGCVPGAWTPSRVQEGERQASSPASPLLELALPRAALPSHCPGDETHKDPGMDMESFCGTEEGLSNGNSAVDEVMKISERCGGVRHEMVENIIPSGLHFVRVNPAGVRSSLKRYPPPPPCRGALVHRMAEREAQGAPLPGSCRNFGANALLRYSVCDSFVGAFKQKNYTWFEILRCVVFND
eukprot:gene2550-1600_t